MLIFSPAQGLLRAAYVDGTAGEEELVDDVGLHL
jgi:hypothetical protein